MEIEKIDVLEILLIFDLCRGMNENAYIFIFSLPFPWQTRLSIFSFSSVFFFLVGNGAFWNCHAKEATSEMFVFMQYYKRLG